MTIPATNTFGIVGRETRRRHDPETIEFGSQELRRVTVGRHPGRPEVGSGLLGRFHTRQGGRHRPGDDAFETIGAALGHRAGLPDGLATIEAEAAERTGRGHRLELRETETGSPVQIFHRRVRPTLGDAHRLVVADASHLTDAESDDRLVCAPGGRIGTTGRWTELWLVGLLVGLEHGFGG